MSAIDQLFRDLRSRSQKAFMPFITAGDPDLDFTAAAVADAGRARLQHAANWGFPIAIRSPTAR